MELSDITLEQAKRILEYTWLWEYEDLEINYHPFVESHGSDAYEACIISFQGNVNNRVKTYKLHIHANLSYEICEYEPMNNGVMRAIGGRLPNRNAWYIYKMFNEWKLYPQDEAIRREMMINNIQD